MAQNLEELAADASALLDENKRLRNLCETLGAGDHELLTVITPRSNYRGDERRSRCPALC